MLILHTVRSDGVRTPLTSFLMLLVMTSSFNFVMSSCPASEGATEDARTVVKGRCILYTTLVNPQAFCGRATRVNCSEVADSFIQAFAYQDPCRINMTRYDEFLTLTRHDIADSKTQFWSGTYGVVHQYSQGGKRVMTLEDTLTGYLIDSLRFCSSPGEPGGIGGPATTNCPSFYQTEGCRWSAEASFWAATSKNFAIKAKGVISVMLNASREEAFRSSSYFVTWELANLNDDVITRFDIILAHVPGDVVRHTCESDNIKALKSQLDTRSIQYTCTSNPPDLMWMLCGNHRDKSECQNFVSSGSESTVTMATTASHHLRWIFSLIFLVYHLL